MKEILKRFGRFLEHYLICIDETMTEKDKLAAHHRVEKGEQ